MRTIKQGILALCLLLTPVLPSFAVVDQTLEVQGTNLVLSWPSQGYEYYMIQYWPDLLVPSVQLTNCVPANSTNRTTFTVPCCLLSQYAGSGGSESFSSTSLSMMSSESASSPWGDVSSLWVMPGNSSSGAAPLAIYPPGYNTNGFIFEQPQQPENEVMISSSAESFEGASGAGPMALSNGGCDCPDMGFFRVWHIPDWLATITNYSFDGPTFIPVDFKDYRDRIDDLTLLVNGKQTPYAQFVPYAYGGQTNWGMGIYFDRLPNGTNTIQLLSSLRNSDTFDDNTPYLVLSNLTRAITLQNAILFTNWDDLMISNTYTLRAYSIATNVDWEIDIYDVNNDFVNYQTGHSSDGYIEWTWDLMDYYGSSRVDDSDPFFYPYITVTPVSSGGSAGPLAGSGSTSRWMPPIANQFPSEGAWLTSYMDNYYDDQTTNYAGADSYYNPGIGNIAGAPTLWDIASFTHPLNTGPTIRKPSATRVGISCSGGISNHGWSETSIISGMERLTLSGAT